MKKILLWVALASTGGGTASGAAQGCARVAVLARVEVARAVVTLADLLGPETCPELLTEAARLRLGRAPLAGSDRVLEGETVRALLLRAAAGRIRFSAAGGLAISDLRIPERVTLRRAAPEVAPLGEPLKGNPTARPERGQTSPPAVHAGELVRLLWEQDGIRSIMPVTCLDRGAVGARVRARIEPGGRIVAATVMESGLLRAIL